jgi:hypothetical protein
MCDCPRKFTKYNEEYDAKYCSKCGEWIDEKCTDEDCSFCSNRPETAL